MKKFLILFLFFVSFVYSQARRVEVVSVYCKKEVLDGKVFIHREDIVNNEKKEVWSVDGKMVGYEEYEEVVLDAEKEVRRKERRVQEEQRKRAQEFKCEALITLNKKILRLTVENLDKTFKKFDSHNLANFLDFRSSTVPSLDVFSELKEKIIPEAKKLIYTPDEESNWVHLNSMVAKLDTVPSCVEGLFYDTVRNAIKQCDDTKTLKELLEIVSEV